MKRYTFLYEIPIFYCFLIFFNKVFVSELPGFINISPHPYWLGVLAFGFYYGVLAGFISGFFAAALYLTMTWYYGEPYLFEDTTFYALPSLFMIIGTLIGAGVQRYRGMIYKLLKDKTQLYTQEKSLKEEIHTQQEIISELEKRIVSRMSTLITLYEGARKLEAVEMKELYQAILNFVCKTLEATQAAIYIKQNDRYVLQEKFGWSEENEKEHFFYYGKGVAGQSVAKEKILTIKDFLSQDEVDWEKVETNQNCLMAGPLRIGDSGEIIGVLCIQQIPFLNFNTASISLFSFLLNWANRAIGRADYIQNLKAHEIIDPQLGIYSYRYLQTRSEEEFARSKTYYLPLSVALVSLEGLEKLTAKQQLAVRLAVSQLLKENCRSMDVVSAYPDDKFQFAILMITVSQGQAEAIKKEILEQFSVLHFPEKIRLKIGIASFKPNMENFETLVENAKKDVASDSAAA